MINISENIQWVNPMRGLKVYNAQFHELMSRVVQHQQPIQRVDMNKAQQCMPLLQY